MDAVANVDYDPDTQKRLGYIENFIDIKNTTSKQELGKSCGYWDWPHSHIPCFLLLISAKQTSANVDLTSGTISTVGTGSTSGARNETH